VELNSKLLIARDNEGMTAWHWAAYQRNIYIYIYTVERKGLPEENLTRGEIYNKLLLAKGNAGMTALHEAAYVGKLYVLLQVLDWA